MTSRTITLDEGHEFRTVDGRLHSVDDQPCVTYTNGTLWWYHEGKLHRDGGPAVIWANGVEEWWQNDRRHRTDGPAVTYPDTDAVHDPRLRGMKQWWTEGRMTRQER